MDDVIDVAEAEAGVVSVVVDACIDADTVELELVAPFSVAFEFVMAFVWFLY